MKPANLVAFGRLLRRAGLDVTPEATRTFARAVSSVRLDRRAEVKAAGRAVFVRRRDDREVFDRAFDLFWRRYGPIGSDAPPLPKLRQDRYNPPTFPVQDECTETATASAEPTEARTIATRTERLRNADFATLTAAEALDAYAMVKALRPRLPQRASRRWLVRKRAGGRPARSQILRAALRSLGEPIVWRSLRHPRRPRPIVMICDISGSMQAYSRLMLRFAHAVGQSGAPVEVFVFATRLTRITRQLAVRNADAALARVGRHVIDWNGGTRIADSLHELNRKWVRRAIRNSAIVLVVSDGWERGDPDRLAIEMASLRRSCHRLFWLNPLAAQQGFEPAVRGLIAALPFVDAMLPCASVANLQALARRLPID